jgi:hypothetical protein
VLASPDQSGSHAANGNRPAWLPDNRTIVL